VSGGDTEAPHLVNPLIDCSSLDLTDQNLCADDFNGASLTDEVDALYTDNCDADVTVTLTGTTPGVGNTDCSWTYTYEYTIEDNCENTTTCEVTVSGGDTEAPHLVNPLIDCSSLDLTDQNLCADDFNGASLTDEVDALYTDNCDADVTVTLTGTTPGVGNTDCSWTYTYEYTIEDNCENTTTCEVTVSGGDTEAPHLVNPLIDCSSLDLTDQNLCADDFNGASLTDEVDALYTDNCDADVTVTLTGTTPGVGNTDCSWTYTYEYTIEDNCENTTTCEVTVSGGDTEAPHLVNPLIDCSSLDLTDQNLCADDFNGASLTDEVDALYTDNCDADVTVTLTGTTPGVGNTDCSWTYTYEYTIEDNCENTTTCEVTVSGGDTEAPHLVNPLIDCSSLDLTDQNLCADDFNGASLTDEVDALYTDNCDADVTVTLTGTTPGVGNTDCSWTYTYEYTIEDNCENTTTCEVTVSGGDTEAPHLVNPLIDCSSLDLTDQNLCADDFNGASLTDEVDALYTDNCDADVTVTLTGTTPGVGNTDCSWTYTYEYTIEDNCENTTTCEVTVSGGDTEAPHLVNPLIDCSSLDLTDQNLCADDFNGASLTDEVDALYTDNCDADVTVTLTGTTPGVGNTDCSWTYTYEYTIEDNCENTTTCEVTVSGGDTEAPHLVNPLIDCSSLDLTDQNLCADDFNGASLTDEVDALYTDNCDADVTVTLTGTTPGVGNTDCSWTYTYEYTIEDNCENTTTCEVTVSGGDTEAPHLVNPLIDCSSLDLTDQNLCADDFNGASLTAEVDALYTDNCDADVTVTLTGTTPGVGNTDCSWTYTYEYTIEDNCENTTTCEVTVSGGDTEAPHLVNPLIDCSSLDLTDQNLCADDFNGASLTDEVDALYTDNCDADVTVTLTGTTPGVGNT